MPVPDGRAFEQRVRRYPFAFVPFAVAGVGAAAGLAVALVVGVRLGVGTTCGALGLLLLYALVWLEPLAGRAGLRRRPTFAWLVGSVSGIAWMLFWSRVSEGSHAPWLGPGAFGAGLGAAVGVSWWELMVGDGLRKARAHATTAHQARERAG